MLPSTRDHVGGDRVRSLDAARTTVDLAAGATATTAATMLDREEADSPTTKHNEHAALSSPLLSPQALVPGAAGSTPPQWGGFGPGHVPKYFRGKFGVAGERKRLIHPQKGEGGFDEHNKKSASYRTTGRRDGGVPQALNSFEGEPADPSSSSASVVGGVGGGDRSLCSSMFTPDFEGGVSLFSPPPVPELLVARP
ncbi:unnamed protein product [Ectocarpus sp. 4 AP-2014]